MKTRNRAAKAIVILAAGRGERMNSSLPKVLHNISGRPMLRHVLDSALRLNPSKIVIVTGEHYKEIKNLINPPTPPFRKGGKGGFEKGQKGIISFIIQKVPMGTGDALLKARTALKGFKGTIVVLNGDAPLVTTETLNRFLGLHSRDRNSISLISFIASDPAAYGRVIGDDSGSILSIVEEKDATNAQKGIKEVNSGVYAIESGVLDLLKKIPLNKPKGEYYLTDIIGIARKERYRVKAYCIGLEEEMLGVNTIAELLRAQQTYRRRLIRSWIGKGVLFLDNDSVFISPEVVIGKETTIYPDVHLEGKTKIGSGCIIFPNVRIVDSLVEEGAVIKDSTVIESSIIRSNASIGPFAHIRPGCDIGFRAKIGNFVEVKKSVIGEGTKASHLSYLGDASVGRDVNVGAGTITCNYDGKNKHKTTIGDNVFIGSDTQLIAPVRVGKGAYIGAGSTITKVVPPMALALSRAEQKNIKDWAKKRQLSVVSPQSSVRNKKSNIKRGRGNR